MVIINTSLAHNGVILLFWPLLHLLIGDCDGLYSVQKEAVSVLAQQVVQKRKLWSFERP